MKPENAFKVVLSCFVLHNFVRKRDRIDKSDLIDDNDNTSFQLEADTSATIGRPGQQALDIRNEFAELFMSSLFVPWQFERPQLVETFG